MPAKIFEVEGIGRLQIYKRRNNRSIRLSLSSKGEVRVSLPHYLPYQAALSFAKTHKGWIEKHRPASSSLLKSGDRIGKAHQLRFKVVDSSRIRISVKNSEITVHMPQGVDAFSKQAQLAAERGAKKALKLEAETLLPQRLHSLASKYEFKFNSVQVRQLSSKWGSCSQNHDITLNYYLMQLPWQMIDYVLIHELVHTEFLSHGKDFWQRFESILPEAKKIRKLLKTYRTEVISSTLRSSSNTVLTEDGL